MNRWLYEPKELENTPSRKEKTSREEEDQSRRDGYNLIKGVGESLKLITNPTLATAAVYFHRFYMKHSFKEFNKELTALACLFLAGKVEETPKKCRDLVSEADRQGLTDRRYQPEEVMAYERVLLQTIRFDLQVEHPYQYLLQYAKILPLEQKSKNIVQMSWTFINDSLATTLCLQWEPEIIAIALLYLACKIQGVVVSTWKGRTLHALPDEHWWDQFVENLSNDLVEEICHSVLDLYGSQQQQQQQQQQQPGHQQPSTFSSASSSAITNAISQTHPVTSQENECGGGIPPPTGTMRVVAQHIPRGLPSSANAVVTSSVATTGPPAHQQPAVYGGGGLHQSASAGAMLNLNRPPPTITQQPPPSQAPLSNNPFGVGMPPSTVQQHQQQQQQQQYVQQSGPPGFSSMPPAGGGGGHPSSVGHQLQRQVSAPPNPSGAPPLPGPHFQPPPPNLARASLMSGFHPSVAPPPFFNQHAPPPSGPPPFGQPPPY